MCTILLLINIILRAFETRLLNYFVYDLEILHKGKNACVPP